MSLDPYWIENGAKKIIRERGCSHFLSDEDLAACLASGDFVSACADHFVAHPAKVIYPEYRDAVVAEARRVLAVGEVCHL